MRRGLKLKIPWNEETKIIIISFLAVIAIIAIFIFIIELTKNRKPCSENIYIYNTFNKSENEPVINTSNEVLEENNTNEVLAKEEPTLLRNKKIRYYRSFTANLIQADDLVKLWYNELKNNLLSYKKIKSRISWRYETFRYGRKLIAKFRFRGKKLCLFLPLNALDFVDTKYKVEDVSSNKNYIETPCMYRIKNNRRVKYAKYLISLVTEAYAIPSLEKERVDYYKPYEDLDTLLNQGLIKCKQLS